MLTFNSRRITIQQLFEWSRKFKEFLCRGDINKLMIIYDEAVDEDDIGWSPTIRALQLEPLEQRSSKLKETESMQQALPSNFEGFKDKYFQEKYHEDFLSEMQWLFENVEMVEDLCKRIDCMLLYILCMHFTGCEMICPCSRSGL